MALKYHTNPKNVEFPSHHAVMENCNKIDMAVMGFVLPKYDEFTRSCRGYHRHGHGGELSSGGSIVSAMVLCGGLICEDAAEIVMVGEC